MTPFRKRISILPGLDWLFLTALILVPRLLNLDVFLTADEPLFLAHAREFATAGRSGSWQLTQGIGYPGVTVAAWSAPFVDLAQTEMGAYALGRAATALLSGGLMLLLYGLVRGLIGRRAAFVGVALLALDPYTLSYSRLLHIAAPLALLMTLAGVAYLRYLAEGRRRWLWLAGLFSGLALLTKSTALLLAPMLAAMLVGWAIMTGRWRTWRWWLPRALEGGLIVAVAAAVFVLLWPAIWVEPWESLSLTFGKLLNDQEAGTGNLGMFWLGQFVQNPGPAFYPVAFLLKATPWLLVGLVLSLFFLGRRQVAGSRLQVAGKQGGRGAREQGAGERGAGEQEGAGDGIGISPPDPPKGGAKRQIPPSGGLGGPESATQTTSDQGQMTNDQHITHHSSLITPLSLWLFALTYLIIMTIASKKSIRYMLPAFPTFYLLAGLGYHQFGRWLAHRAESRVQSPEVRIQNTESNHVSRFTFHVSRFINYSSLIKPLLFLPVIILTLAYHPYYLSYYNPALVGWRWAPQTLLVGWGEGLDQAAEYLQQHNADGRVTAWYEWLFPILYDGDVQPVVPPENLLTADHAVLYINQVQRNIPDPNLIHYFRERRQPEHTVRLNGIEYAWVYAGPVASTTLAPSPRVPLGGQFGDAVQLLGYDLGAQPAEGGQPLIVTLYWRVLTPPAGERFVYVRLVDADGRVWASTDSPPVMGFWPVSRWQPEMIIEDAQSLPVPAGTPPGSYRLEVGLYDPANGQPLPASGQPLGQGGGLLLGEVNVAWRALPETDLEGLTPADAALSDNAALVGYTSPPAAASTGDVVPLSLLWQETVPWWAFGTIRENFVRFEWYQAGVLQAEQLESLPLPIEQWGDGALLHSQYSAIVPPELASGRYALQITLHNGSDPAGPPFELGRLAVTAPQHRFDLPDKVLLPEMAGRFSARGDTQVALAGYTLAQTDLALDLTLHWQATASLPTGYKVFVQLLDQESQLVAQSDTVPAAGQRPTTGWLAGEIIADAHTLALPPDLPAGSYRLITGLYNPATGQRLPLIDAAGSPIADALHVIEIDLAKREE